MEYIFLIIMGIYFIAVSILNYLQKQIIKSYENKLSQMHDKTDYILEYCLTIILNSNVNSENYEEAEICRMLIEDLKKIKTK
jgi:hypothetical protein